MWFKVPFGPQNVSIFQIADAWMHFFRPGQSLHVVIQPITASSAGSFPWYLLLWLICRFFSYFVFAPLEAQLPFTAAAVVLAQSFVALPFLVVASEAGLRAVDPRQLEAARTLGASPWTLLVRVRLPLALPSLMAGLVLAWARALGEFGATITFAGNLQGRTRTLPLALFSALENDPELALVLGAVLIALAAGVLVLLRGRWLPLGSTPRASGGEERQG